MPHRVFGRFEPWTDVCRCARDQSFCIVIRMATTSEMHGIKRKSTHPIGQTSARSSRVSKIANEEALLERTILGMIYQDRHTKKHHHIQPLQIFRFSVFQFFSLPLLPSTQGAHYESPGQRPGKRANPKMRGPTA